MSVVLVYCLPSHLRLHSGRDQGNADLIPVDDWIVWMQARGDGGSG
jgi:hypothetical protein